MSSATLDHVLAALTGISEQFDLLMSRLNIDVPTGPYTKEEIEAKAGRIQATGQGSGSGPLILFRGSVGAGSGAALVAEAETIDVTPTDINTALPTDIKVIDVPRSPDVGDYMRETAQSTRESTTAIQNQSLAAARNAIALERAINRLRVVVIVGTVAVLGVGSAVITLLSVIAKGH